MNNNKNKFMILEPISNKDDCKSLNDNQAILCQHCRRTKTNGIRCLGICVADSDY